jgi:hypothetical protein
MAEFLLVVERLMADGADAAMFVSEDTYKGAMFGCIFAEPVHGYVWCNKHGWVLADEACVCDDCVHEAMEADFERLCEIEERAWLETERAAEWAVQQFVSQTRLTDEEEAVIGAQVDAWSDRGMAWEDIVAKEPRAMFLPTR